MKHKLMLAAALVTALPIPLSSFDQFEGVLSLIPTGCQVTGKCTLKNKLRFTDSAKVGWEVKAVGAMATKTNTLHSTISVRKAPQAG